MYEAFFRLRDRPFELTANPQFLYLTPQHQEALSNLQYGLASAKAATLLTGEAGTGKTTLLRAALESAPCRHVRRISINNPALTRTEFFELIARSLELSADAVHSKSVLLTELETAVKESRARGVVTALVVDEAQSLTLELLEEIRLLANLETASEKLLPLVLVGQPDFTLRLESPALRQLKQRVALRCEIAPFTVKETGGYIATRIRRAGGVAERLFTREAVVRIHQYAGGIARTISVICDNALVQAFALSRARVDQAIVTDVARDFRLGEWAFSPAPTDRSTSMLLDGPPQRPVAAFRPQAPEARVDSPLSPEGGAPRFRNPSHGDTAPRLRFSRDTP